MVTNRNLLLVIAGLLLSINSWGQELSRVHGQLLESNNKSGMVGATVQLISVRDTTQYFVTATDKNGFYQFNKVPATFYKFIYSSIGYKTEQKFVRVKGEDTDLGVFEAYQDTAVLDMVEINAKVLVVVVNQQLTSLALQHQVRTFHRSLRAQQQHALSKVSLMLSILGG